MSGINENLALAYEITPPGIIASMPSRDQIELAHAASATLPEIAHMLGLTHEALYQLERGHEAFPLPVAVYGQARVYVIDEVLAFHRTVGRIYGRGRVLNVRSRA